MGNEGADKVAFVLHGILGSGQNFRGFVSKLSRERPDWQFVLVDLRNHGRSRPAPPPHTLEACARDLIELGAHLGRVPGVVMGHSFGGKVGLKYAELGAPGLGQLWLLDSNPGAQVPQADNEVLRVIAAAKSIPEPITRRRDLVQALLDAGLSSAIASWMTTNLSSEGERYVWTLDFPAIEALLQDYFDRDLWSFLESPKSSPLTHFVIAEQSDRLKPHLRARALALPPESGVRAHVLPDSGHWVHVDNPEGLLALFKQHFPE
jgi:pimeloyl-ACP methyl ester carboxylesterase